MKKSSRFGGLLLTLLGAMVVLNNLGSPLILRGAVHTAAVSRVF
jgi:hypothetical protein